ncbi:hypothetical protein NBRC110019_29820 [Neptunitalea chrysea]|uniref:Uncharacterized protein n=1 Tax=Neptunitalea chrysea TaxID=1647581 RepID=A0A9W6B6U0_9FLAO|nr:hypothetical protein NBRC110019_29820 [Neptunitalea chrysea]
MLKSSISETESDALSNLNFFLKSVLFKYLFFCCPGANDFALLAPVAFLECLGEVHAFNACMLVITQEIVTDDKSNTDNTKTTIFFYFLG